jgi:hypothetical protein
MSPISFIRRGAPVATCISVVATAVTLLGADVPANSYARERAAATGAAGVISGASSIDGHETLLYVIDSDHGVLTRKDGGLVLRLTDLRGDVTWFDDHPARHAGRQALQQFVDQWKSAGFVSDPPNAVIQQGSGKNQTSTAVVLSQPTLNASSGTMTFRVRADSGASVKRLGHDLGRVALFVDDGSTTATQRLTLNFQGVMPGATLEANIGGLGGAAVSWGTGAAFSSTGGLQIASGGAGSPLAITSLNLTPTGLSIGTSDQAGSGLPMNFSVSLYMSAPVGTTTIRLDAPNDYTSFVTASIGGGASVALGPDWETFNWS